MDLNLRRITLITLFVFPLTTLFLMMTGIALTHAAMLQKRAGLTQGSPAATPQAAAAESFSHVPAGPDGIVPATTETVQAASPALSVTVKPAFGSITDRILAAMATGPLVIFLLFNWMVRRRGYGSGVREGSLGSSSASTR